MKKYFKKQKNDTFFVKKVTKRKEKERGGAKLLPLHSLSQGLITPFFFSFSSPNL